jgi:adenosylhomocysteinase
MARHEEEDFQLPPEIRLHLYAESLEEAHKKIDELIDKVEKIHKEIFKPELTAVDALKQAVLSDRQFDRERKYKKSKVRDMSLAAEGKLQIEWAERQMPVLVKIRERFEKRKPLAGLKIAACMHVTKETAVLMRTLHAAGADVALCGSNPLSTQDAIAAALADEGINVFAWRGLNNQDYYWCINQVLDIQPNITLDDGADLVSTIHSKRQELMKNIFAGQEETTTGVIRLKSMARDAALKYPVIAVNDTPTKNLFDNYYGTGQSTLDGIMRATNILLAGKIFVVCGYGHCGKGIATKAKGMGANTVIVETDPVKALQALMDGFLVMSIGDASSFGDIFVTATGDKNVIRGEHIEQMKDGAILANSGHFNVEISIPDLEKLSSSKRKIRESVEEYKLTDGRKIYLLAEGRLVNLAAAEGHPSSVMDMSFANQALVCEWIVKNYADLEDGVHDVPKEIDTEVAELKLESMGIKIDKLTDEQAKYLSSWEEGT